ncbi:class I SAM-dependent methyltransferase [Solitalea lacus]|uniref:class I SAM-dependent methyltransferase n=1 Tax=Solitalea lacus TaxID=2911172 RepID=UPI001EDB727B|nr:class I SAM-dependent methyltransferase [Solitalea lacus]UKJ08393.1 class I SAM-dependent methyltransferase [Solitalea lacus]
MKDIFSGIAKEYSQFRPGYPEELFDFLLQQVNNRKLAWDCGTGNGQVAVKLANYFDQVYATDISENQLLNALKKENITYQCAAAEHTTFSNSTFDLITVAQAIHWFNFEQFYTEVKRTLKPNGIIAVIGYGLLKTEPQTNTLINYFYNDVLGSYWDDERKYIDEGYQTIPFPFKEINAPTFTNTYHWTKEQFIGYLNTWSAVQHYISKNGENPLDLIEKELNSFWKNDEVKAVTFPILLRIGKYDAPSHSSPS